MNGRSPQNTHRSDRSDLEYPYESQFPPKGEAVPGKEPSRGIEEPLPRPEEGVEVKPQPPLEQPLEPEAPAPEVRPERVEEVEATPTEIGESAVESAEGGEFDEAIEKLEQAKAAEGEGSEKE